SIVRRKLLTIGASRAMVRSRMRRRLAEPAHSWRSQIMPRVAICFALAALASVVASASSAQTLAAVKARGVLNCGANGELAGFGMPDAQGRWTGFDVDYCRAIAAAIFNDPNKVKFTKLTATDRFTALQSREVDVLVRNTTWTSSRDTTSGL